MPVVCAENDFNTYQSLILSNVILGDINIVETGSDPLLEYLEADILLFPKENFQQSVIDQAITTTPGYESSSITDETMLLKWEYVSDDEISFNIDTTLEVKNDFPKISETVDFPISSMTQSLERYTDETEHIDLNSEIREKANEIVAGETDLFIATYKLGDWVKNNIDYDLNTLTEEVDQKASWVFANKQGVCDEITNLFIAMLRSVNIPARFVSGIVYSNLDNSFGNHGWAEVYFPDHGWIPFDITFGQYGWVDPTHIKLDDSYDSGAPSVEYSWRSRDIEVKAKSLKFETEIKQKEGSLSPYVNLEVNPLKDKVRFGSYVPIEVFVENLKNYYTPMIVFVSKAPELLEEANVKYFVLRPKEKKRLYWVVEIPSDLEEEYVYTSELEVKTVFGTIASNSVKYAESFDYYSKKWAEETVETLSEREKKFFFSNIELECSKDKESYYSIEDAVISCSVINRGNVQLRDVRVCLAEDCKTTSLSIGGKKEVSFTKSLTKSETVTISAENDDMIRYAEVGLDVVEIPDLQILEVEPKSVGYNEKSTLIISLVTESPAYNIELNIKNLGVANLEKLSTKRDLEIPFEGKVFSEGFIQIHMSYDDSLGKTYTKDRKITIKITNIPSHIKIWLWLKDLLGI